MNKVLLGILFSSLLIGCMPVADNGLNPNGGINGGNNTGAPGDFNGKWKGLSVFRADDFTYKITISGLPKNFNMQFEIFDIKGKELELYQMNGVIEGNQIEDSGHNPFGTIGQTGFEITGLSYFSIRAGSNGSMINIVGSAILTNGKKFNFQANLSRIGSEPSQALNP